MVKIVDADEDAPIVRGMRAIDKVIKKEVLEGNLDIIEALESLLNYSIMLTAEISIEDGWEEDELMGKIQQLRDMLTQGVMNEVKVRRQKLKDQGE